MVRCIDCRHFNLKGSPLGKLGLGLCPLRSMSAGHTFSAFFEKECARFTPAEPSTVEKREHELAKAERQEVNR